MVTLGRLTDFKQGKWYAATTTVGTGSEQTAGKSWQLDELVNWRSHDDHKDGQDAFTPALDAVNFYTAWKQQVDTNDDTVPDTTLTLTMESDVARGFLYKRQERNERYLLYRHDALGRLVEVTRETAGSPTVLTRYGYLADGRLAWRQDGSSGSKEWVIYDGSAPLLQGTDAQRRWTYVWSGGTLIKSQDVGGVETHVHQDRLGSVVLQTKSSAGTVQTHGHAVYDPYGRGVTTPAWGANNLDVPFGYAGSRVEESVGLQLMGARWYDATLGRFIEQDPIGEAGGVNVYAYTGSSPVSWVDPSGLRHHQLYDSSSFGSAPRTSFITSKTTVDGMSQVNPLTGTNSNWSNRMMANHSSLCGNESDEQLKSIGAANAAHAAAQEAAKKAKEAQEQVEKEKKQGEEGKTDQKTNEQKENGAAPESETTPESEQEEPKDQQPNDKTTTLWVVNLDVAKTKLPFSGN